MKTIRARRCVLVAVAGLAAAFGGRAGALEFDLAGIPLKIDNLATVGALVRMQQRDNSLVGKSTVARQLGTPVRSNGIVGLCLSRDGDDGLSGPTRGAVASYRGDTCSGTRAGGNERAVAAPGAFSPNGDEGNLNFEKYDVAYATAKLTSDINLELAGFNGFVRTVGYLDGIYSGFQESHPDTTFQPRGVRYNRSAEDRSGHRLGLLDYFVSRKFDLGERHFNLKVGNQGLNWGESSFLLANSLNAINPPNQALLRVPGFDVKELLQPVGMALLEGDVTEGVSFQTFYQYDWKPIIVDPVGSFFSVSDTLGEGGRYAMLSFSKAPEDPDQLYEPYRNPEDPAAVLGSTSSRTLLRDYDAERRFRPSGAGQYGASLKLFLESVNNGTELAFYFANYHARVPSISAFATNATCLRDPVANPLQNAANLIADCGVPIGNIAALAQNTASVGSATYQPATRDALPLDSGRLFVEYPENIRMFGTSFNTTVGDFAISGEYVYRPNLPVQIQSTDLVFALLQPGFPSADYSIGAAILPGRRTAVPDFVGEYRNPGCTPNCFAPGQYIRGYEQLGVGQAGLTLLKTIGGENPLNATQITLLLEMGHTHFFKFPGLDQLQFNGAGTDTHISAGIDGSAGINPVDVRSNPNDPTTNGTTASLRQNPRSYAQIDRGAFGTADSYGYRLVTLTRFDSALLGANLEFLNGFFHDVGGIGPGLGQNFVEGRRQVLSGVRFDYLARFIGELRYTWFTGGGTRDALRDRDNVMLWLGYQF